MNAPGGAGFRVLYFGIRIEVLGVRIFKVVGFRVLGYSGVGFLALSGLRMFRVVYFGFRVEVLRLRILIGLFIGGGGGFGIRV